MKDFFKKFNLRGSMLSLALIIIGILFIIFPSSSATVICYVFGGLLLALGILNLVTYFNTRRKEENSSDLATGLAYVIIGILLFVRPAFIADFLTIIFGVALIVDGAVKMQKFANMCKLRQKNRWALLATAVLSLVLGAVMVFDPFSSRNVLMIFAGVSLIIDGAAGLAVNPVTREKPTEDKIIDLEDEDIHVN